MLRPEAITSSSERPFPLRMAPILSNALVATTCWGVINTPSGVSTIATRSPRLSPSFLRISVGMVTCPFSWILTNLRSFIRAHFQKIILSESVSHYNSRFVWSRGLCCAIKLYWGLTGLWMEQPVEYQPQHGILRQTAPAVSEDETARAIRTRCEGRHS